MDAVCAKSHVFFIGNSIILMLLLVWLRQFWLFLLFVGLGHSLLKTGKNTRGHRLNVLQWLRKPDILTDPSQPPLKSDFKFAPIWLIVHRCRANTFKSSRVWTTACEPRVLSSVCRLSFLSFPCRLRNKLPLGDNKVYQRPSLVQGDVSHTLSTHKWVMLEQNYHKHIIYGLFWVLRIQSRS